MLRCQGVGAAAFGLSASLFCLNHPSAFTTPVSKNISYIRFLSSSSFCAARDVKSRVGGSAYRRCALLEETSSTRQVTASNAPCPCANDSLNARKLFSLHTCKRSESSPLSGAKQSTDRILRIFSSNALATHQVDIFSQKLVHFFSTKSDSQRGNNFRLRRICLTYELPK